MDKKQYNQLMKKSLGSAWDNKQFFVFVKLSN